MVAAPAPDPTVFEEIPLVSFPKSGNTWLRFILGNIFAREGVTVGFDSIDRLSPTSYSYDRRLVHGNLKPGAPVFIKLHGTREAERDARRARRIVYLVRDGFDAVYSRWHTINREKPGEYPSIESFVRHHWVYYAGHWGQNVHSWLAATGPEAPPLHLLQYEQLKANTAGELRRLFADMNIPVTDTDIERAVENSGVSRMREDAASSQKNRRNLGDFNFVRSAKVSEGHLHLSLEAKAAFLAHRLNRRYMLEFGYLSEEERAAMDRMAVRSDHFFTMNTLLFRAYRKARRRLVGPWRVAV